MQEKLRYNNDIKRKQRADNRLHANQMEVTIMDERNIFSNSDNTQNSGNSCTNPMQTFPQQETMPSAEYGDSFVKGDTAEINSEQLNQNMGAQVYQSAVSNDPYSYERYRSQYSFQEKPDHQPKKKKSSSKGVSKGLLAGALALALGLGFGGGVLGSYLMSSNQNTASSSNGKVVTATAAESKNADLNIVESSTVKNVSTPNSLPEVVKKVKSCVVEITTEATSYNTFYGQYVTKGAGSGVIISSDGYIITNNHVVEGATQVTVTLTDGNEYEAKIIGTDETYDIALLKIEAENLSVATIGTSSDLLVGETAIVIGNPLGKLGGSVSAGIISSSNRYIQLDGKTMELLQTDAAINPGNSGGGMFDGEGNLIGIVVAKSVQTSDGTAVDNIGYAIPIDNVKAILGDLKSKGYVSGRAMLGVNLVDVLTDTALSYYGVEKKGVYVSRVNSGTAAEKAGILTGDMILSFDGVKAENAAELTAAVLKKKAGDTVKVVVYRDGEEVTLTVTLDERTSSTAQTPKNSNGFRSGDDNDYGGNGYGGRGYSIEDFFNDFGY